MPSALTDVEIVRRVLLAAALGGMLGAEREFRHKSAGFRTNILIAVGAALFTILSASLTADTGDPSRVAAQIVTGIGFLGAGAIIRTRAGVQGLTTAATVWVNAALGMAAGSGAYRVGIIGGAVTLAVLLILAPVERVLEQRRVREERAGSPRAR